MMIKKLYLLLLAIIYTIGCYAQDDYTDMGQISSPFPTANMGKPSGNYTVGNVGVDLYTGVGNVNIPIHQYSLDGLDLGISLSYNTKGIKVDQTASSVGLGWQLNAGGFIQRQVKALEDEITIPEVSPNPHYADDVLAAYKRSRGFPYFDPDIFTSTPNYLPELRGRAVNSTARSDGHKFQKDGETDELTMCFAGRKLRVVGVTSGSMTVPYSAISITPIVNNVAYQYASLPNIIGSSATQDLLSYVIVDESGNKFEFVNGGVEEKLSFYNTFYYPTIRWVLKKITTSAGHVVNYNYVYSDVEYEQYRLDTVQEYISTNTIGDMASNNIKVKYKSLAQLSSIEYPDGTIVTFNLNNGRCEFSGEKVVGSISISKGNLDVSHTITYQFNYKYFNGIAPTSSPAFTPAEISYDPTSCPHIATLATAHSISTEFATSVVKKALRLKLKSIERIGMDNSTEPYYTFTYNDANKLPFRLSASQDWYGYYNGQIEMSVNGHSLMVPLHTFAGQTYGVDRTPNIDYLKYGILTEFKSALGGTTTLEYTAPPNLQNAYYQNYNKSVSPPEMGITDTYDGLCISSIMLKDNFNVSNSVKTLFSYSLGYRFYPGGYFWYPTEYINITGNLPVTAASQLSKRLYSSACVTPLDFYNGSNHGYGLVQVDKEGYNAEKLGYMRYEFSNVSSNSSKNNDYFSNDKSKAYYVTLPPLHMNKGLLGRLNRYTEYGIPNVNGVTPFLKQVTYEYVDIGQSVTNNAFFSTVMHIYNGLNYTLSQYTLKGIYYVDGTSPLISSVSTIDYSNGYGMIDYVSYEYNSNGLPGDIAAIHRANNRGAHYTTRFEYANDYAGFYGLYFYSPYNFFNIANKPVLDRMARLHFPILEETYMCESNELCDVDVNNGYGKILSFMQKKYDYDNDVLTLRSIARAPIKDPVVDTLFHFSGYYQPNWPGIYERQPAIGNTCYNYDGQVEVTDEYTLHDDHNNCLEHWTRKHTTCESAIWDTHIGSKIASVANAKYTDIAYSSFESEYASGADYNKGNWNFNPAYVYFHNGSNAITGRYSYTLSNTSNNDITSVEEFTANKKYLLSFWANGNEPKVYIGNGFVVASTLIQQAQVGDWKLYTTYFTGGGPVKITHPFTGNCQIDELRVHPADAGMATTTYEPLKGTTSVCDERNNIMYYEYDGFGRPTVTRDINRKILSVQKHVIQGSDN